MKVGKVKSCSAMTLCKPRDYTVQGILQARIWIGSYSLLQGIFPAQGLKPGLPHCRWILFHLRHLSHREAQVEPNPWTTCTDALHTSPPRSRAIRSARSYSRGGSRPTISVIAWSIRGYKDSSHLQSPKPHPGPRSLESWWPPYLSRRSQRKEGHPASCVSGLTFLPVPSKALQDTWNVC